MTTRSRISRVRSWCRSKREDYVVFTKSIFFILGLILSYKLVEKTFLDILITVLNDAWDNYDLRTALIVVNFQECTTGVLAVFFAYAADIYTGRFKMLLFSSTVCIIGLSLNSAAARDDEMNLKLFYPALVLMTLAQAAQIVTLQPFLEDQLRRPPTGPTSAGDGDGEGAWRRQSRFWWILVSVVAAISSLPLVKLETETLAIVLTGLMLVCFLVFLLGTKNYSFVATMENPFKNVGTFILSKICMRKVEYPQTPEGRLLDRAGVVQEQEIQRGKGSPLSLKEVRRVKLFLKMFPLWCILLILSLVSASGSTFFIVEAFSLSGESLTPILLFSSLQRFTEISSWGISCYITEKLRKRKAYNMQKMELVRIGIGLLFCVPCYIAAWATASARMRHENSSSNNTDDSNSMNVYLLTPQYLFLGIMRGLCTEGFESFYESQVSETLKRFGPLFLEFMMVVGNYTCALCILIFSRIGWFESELDDSRLDRYYIFLAVLSLCNVVFFCLFARWCLNDVFLVGGDGEMGVADHKGLLPVDDRAIEGPQGRIDTSGDNILGELPEFPLLKSASIYKRSSSISLWTLL